MRLPNNYGTVYKLKGNRRRPWIARKQMGEIVDYSTGRVKRHYKTVGYYATKGEAIAALGAFNDVTDPSKTAATITVCELYDRWSKEHYKNIKNPKAYRGAFAMLKPLWDEPFESLKLDEIIVCLAKSGKSETMKAVAKSILMQMSDYGMIHELIQNDRRGIYRHIPVGDRSPKIVRRIFTPDEIRKCWQLHQLHDNIVLILLYTGVRTSELLALTENDVDWSAQCFHIRQAKTKAGGWRYDVTSVGYKCNMTDVAAAMGLVELARYDQLILPRRKQIFDQGHRYFCLGCRVDSQRGNANFSLSVGNRH